eukprot:GHVP01011101.1.p1 GENE.GHVP01011101.1~~GHVP01011101.1.p1  ORF type:complete len:109 (+),score=23.17 GHVP01011101.1:41-367(+)
MQAEKKIILALENLCIDHCGGWNLIENFKWKATDLLGLQLCFCRGETELEKKFFHLHADMREGLFATSCDLETSDGTNDLLTRLGSDDVLVVKYIVEIFGRVFTKEDE